MWFTLDGVLKLADVLLKGVDRVKSLSKERRERIINAMGLMAIELDEFIASVDGKSRALESCLNLQAYVPHLDEILSDVASKAEIENIKEGFNSVWKTTNIEEITGNSSTVNSSEELMRIRELALNVRARLIALTNTIKAVR